MFTSAGLPLEYVEVGPRDADPLLLLHGNGPNWRQFLPQLEALEDQWRLVAPSLRGHGASGLPPTASVEDLSLPVLAGDAVALLDHLGIDRCHVVGNSVGGLIGFELVLSDPRRIASLVTFGTTAQLCSSRTVVATVLTATRLLGARNVGRIAGRTASTPAAGRVVQDLIAMADNRALRLIARNVARYDYTGALRHSQVPWLLLRGGHDRDINRVLDSTLAVVRARDDAILRALPRAGHFANLERPAEFNDLLVEFLAQHRMGPAPTPIGA